MKMCPSETSSFFIKPIRWWVIGGAVIILLVALWQGSLASRVQSQRERLLIRPDPVPYWLLHLAPIPGQTLPLSEAHFGEFSDVFWPGYGVICTQLDGVATDIATTKELNSRTILSLNGHEIHQLNIELSKRMPNFLPTYMLLHGFRLVDGIIHVSNAQNVLGLNLCWEMSLEPGEYLASLRVNRKSKLDLYYEWAFRLTDE